MKDVVSVGGKNANDNVQIPMDLDDQLGLHLAGHVGLLVLYLMRFGELELSLLKLCLCFILITSVAVGSTSLFPSISTSISTLISLHSHSRTFR